MRVAVIGAGAAGCFCAVEFGRRCPEAEICIFEAGPKPMAKLAITGGGRCNLTNTFAGVGDLREVYPRGFRLMDRLFHTFGPHDTVEWFENEGVALVAQDDQCIFPQSQDAMEIVRLLHRRLRENGVGICTGCRVGRISPLPEEGFRVEYTASARNVAETVAEDFDKVVVTVGGVRSLQMLEPLGLKLEPAVPSLFTFNIPDKGLRSLMGTVAPDAVVALAGTGFRAGGPLLVTHWGLSGPAALRLSSYAARHLAECGYHATLLVGWTGLDEAELRSLVASMPGQKMVANSPLAGLPSRLWEHIVARSGLRADIRWAELGSKGLSRLLATVMHDEYHIEGQTRFRDEFVTCGGVSLSEINTGTLEARRHKGLYFAGEVLDVDAVTGGFNLQAAWTTGFVAARSLLQ